jgi:hypothetical protein
MATATKTKRPTVQVTLSTFDNTIGRPYYRSPRQHVPLKDFKPISHDEYNPQGMTPLHDAVFAFVEHMRHLADEGEVQVGLLLDESGSMGSQRNEVIEAVNKFVSGMAAVKKVDKKNAGKGFLVIDTDGMENASRNHDARQVAELLQECEKDGWVTIFLGAGIDGWGIGRSMGVTGQSAYMQTVSIPNTAHGHAAGMSAASADTVSWLENSKDYVAAAASADYSSRSVTEDGQTLNYNTNAVPDATKHKVQGGNQVAQKPVFPVNHPLPVQGNTAVDKAISSATDALSGD